MKNKNEKQNAFSKEYDLLLGKHGRASRWIITAWNKYKFPDFYTLMRLNRFTPDEQQQIRSLIIDGDKSEYYYNSK